MKYAVLFLCLIFAPVVLAQGPTSKKTSAAKSQPKATTLKKASTAKSGATTAKKTSAAKSQPKATTVKKASTAKSGATTAKKTTAARSKPKVATPKATTATVRPKPSPTPALSEKEQFEKASAHELAASRVEALEKFLTAFPNSESRPAATELLTSSRILIAEEKLLSGDTADAVTIFKLVVEQLPQPMPDDLFSESIARIPSSLYFRGQRQAALELAAAIESKAEANSSQLLEIANFHLGTENGSEAMRVAAKAAAKDPTSAAVQRTLALAHRINFDLELSADSYAKSLELDPDSIASKRGLAEMKRALGKSDEAATLYRELLVKNDKDVPSRTGLVLALFDAGKRSDAEAELARSLEQTPGNVILLAGAAYWYASKGLSDRAVELAEKAIAREPRYVWSHIALARGLVGQNKPVEAEQALVKARAYGNFPTLEYEVASARMAAGFFREAVEDLRKQFAIAGNGNVKTNLGGRVTREEKSLADLAGFERKASIFTPLAADTTENADALKALLILDQKLGVPEPSEADVAAAADAFTTGSDKMKLHRQMYAASMLLERRIALSKVLELTRSATGNTDSGLEVPNPRAAVLASELYEARAAAFRRNEFLLVPEVPPQTLSAVLRGRIEEIAGWSLYQQNNFPDAIVRLRRAISVLPDKSAWWRSSMWRLGAALAADGKETEALNSYIESYKTDKPDFAKYTVVEALYKKLNGNTEGLEAKIGQDRVASSPSIQEVQTTPTPAQTIDVPSVNTPADTPSVSAAPTPTVAELVIDRSKTAPLTSEPSSKEDATPTEKASDPATEVPAKSEPVVKETSSRPTPTEAPPETVGEIAKPVTETKVPETAIEPADQKTTIPKQDSEPQPAQASEKPAVTDQRSAENKLLFEPIIIRVPNSRSAKPAGDVTKPEKKDAADETKPADEKKPDDPTVTPGASRPRLIDGQEVKVEELPPCTVGVSQENVSLINGGGSIGILVSVDAPGDIKSLTAISSSPKDVELMLEPEIGGISDRRFYVIKSTSSALGVYQVTFATPCGKKDVLVTIR